MSKPLPNNPIRNRPVGRPPALDVTKREVGVALVSVGCTRTQAAKYLEVSPQTVLNTARRDPEFARRLNRAEADLQRKHLRNVRSACGRSWRASVWALQQLAPERFAAIDPQDLPDRSSRSSPCSDT